MKALGKVLFLLIVVALIAFGAWKALDSTLFADDEPTPVVNGTATLPTNVPPPATEPKPLSEDEAFASTSADTDTDPEDLKLSCEAADNILSELYDMRQEGKSYDQALNFLQDDGSIPEEHVNLFVGLANSLWSSPKDQLRPKAEITEQFSEQCLKIEQTQ